MKQGAVQKRTPQESYNAQHNKRRHGKVLRSFQWWHF